MWLIVARREPVVRTDAGGVLSLYYCYGCCPTDAAVLLSCIVAALCWVRCYSSSPLCEGSLDHYVSLEFMSTPQGKIGLC
jgi:hypothetical protein